MAAPCDLAVSTISRFVQMIQTHGEKLLLKQDRKALHQLRVYSRRLQNTLWFFKNRFSSKELKQWKKSLRQVAKTSSMARDVDVQGEFLKKYQSTLQNSAEKKYIGQLRKNLQKTRDALQPAVIKAVSQLGKEKTLLKILKSLKSHPSRERADLYKLAHTRIAKRLNKFLTFEPYVSRPECSKRLHQMRIAGKHVRYTLELLEPIYGKEMKGFIETVLTFHRKLGELHDLDVWLKFLGEDESVFKKYCQDLRKKTYHAFVQAWEIAKKDRVFERLIKFVEASAQRRGRKETHETGATG